MRRLAAIIGLLALVLTACGDDADEVEQAATDDTTTTVAASEDPLYDLAKEEGSVLLYGSPNAEVMEAWVAAFEAEYPGVDAEFVRAGGAETFERLRAEGSAGKTAADVAVLDVLLGVTLHNEGLVADLPDGAVPDGYPDAYVGDWAAITYLTPTVMTWNTDTVTDPPADLDDLLDPAHAGCVVSSPQESLTASLLLDRGYDGAASWFEAFLANGGIMGGSQSSVGPDVAAGAIDCAVNPFVSTVEELLAEGAPVDWAAADPTPVNTTGVYVTEGAPHPNAAALLVRWLLGPGGGAVSAADQRLVLNPDVPLEVSERVQSFLDPDSDLGTRLRPTDIDEVADISADVDRLIETYVVPNLVEDDD